MCASKPSKLGRPYGEQLAAVLTAQTSDTHRFRDDREDIVRQPSPQPHIGRFHHLVPLSDPVGHAEHLGVVPNRI